MELEEMKSLWTEMSAEVHQQKKLTDALILKMTEVNYGRKINKILVPEAIGSIICIAGLVFILINFQQLTIWYLIACGVVSLLILMLLPLLSIRAICKIRSLDVSAQNYKQTLLAYSKGKIQFVFAQKLSFYLGSILILTLFPVVGWIVGGVDLFKETRLWFWYAIAFPFFYYTAQWVFKNYIKTTTDAENILKELKE